MTPNSEGVGPQIGETVPEFTLRDAQDTSRTLRSLMGRRGATIVFFRSADWCAPCKAHLIEMQNHLAELRKEGMNVIAISRDSRSILAEFASRHGITFPLLSDADSAVIKSFGVMDAAVSPTRTEANGGGPPYFGVPYRGTITIDRNRVVTSTFFQKTWQEHTTMSSVLLSLGKNIDVPAARVTTPHLTATAFISDEAVAPGAHFLAVVDVTPARGMHVYAPGATPYRPIAFAVSERPGLVVRGPRFPPSEDYYFKPLDEHVPVYQRPFRITQELMVDPSRAGQAALSGADRMTIDAMLDYQACDDTDCFLPQSIPFAWTVTLKPLDNTRITTAPSESIPAAGGRR